jgi:hypothetical protein
MIVTAGDVRDQRARAEAKQIHREKRAAIANAQMALAAAERNYQNLGGAMWRLVRMKRAKRLRELEQ